MDGVVAARELISHCFRDKARGGMLLKLDFAKAYEMLAWDLLFEVLRARKFGVTWMSWMHIGLSGGKSQIMVNGNPGRIICSRKGSRQGGLVVTN